MTETFTTAKDGEKYNMVCHYMYYLEREMAGAKLVSGRQDVEKLSDTWAESYPPQRHPSTWREQKFRIVYTTGFFTSFKPGGISLTTVQFVEDGKLMISAKELKKVLEYMRKAVSDLPDARIVSANEAFVAA